MSSHKNIAFLVFFRENETLAWKTISEIAYQMRNSIIDFEIVVVRDGATNEPQLEKLIELNNINCKILQVQQSKGVSKAISYGLEVIDAKYVALIPGHNLFRLDNLDKIVESIFFYDFVLCFRMNLFERRPIPKAIGSKMLLIFIKFIFYPYLNGIRDIHGLNIFLKQDLERYIVSSRGHGNNISIIPSLLYNKSRYTQIPIEINQLFSDVNSKFFIFPKISNIAEVIYTALKVRKSFKN